MRTRVFELLKALEIHGPLRRDALKEAIKDYVTPGWGDMPIREALKAGDAFEKDEIIYLNEKGRRALATERRKGKI